MLEVVCADQIKSVGKRPAREGTVMALIIGGVWNRHDR